MSKPLLTENDKMAIIPNNFYIISFANTKYAYAIKSWQELRRVNGLF